MTVTETVPGFYLSVLLVPLEQLKNASVSDKLQAS